jgi:hypothetical protein
MKGNSLFDKVSPEVRAKMYIEAESNIHRLEQAKLNKAITARLAELLTKEFEMNPEFIKLKVYKPEVNRHGIHRITKF